MNNKKIAEYAKQGLLMIVGTFLTGLAISVFLTPNKLVSGGVSGISTILNHTVAIPVSISFAVINIILLLLGFRVLGKEFIIKTLIGTGMLSLFIEITSHIPVLTTNTMLSALFGGILYGAGLGITFISGATTGGTDIIGRLVQYKFPSLPIGKLLLFIDGAVIAAALIVFKEIDLALLGIVSLFLQSVTIDEIIKRMNVSKLAFVITDKGEEISRQLVSESPRGVTIVNATGAYTMQERQVLMCAMKQSEIVTFQNRILEMDPEAFVIFSESQYILGNGFMLYR